MGAANVPRMHTFAVAIDSYRTMPDIGYQAFVRLFCITRGRSNDLMHALIKRRHPRVGTESGARLVGTLTAIERRDLDRSLVDGGMCILPHRLERRVCDELEQWALATPCEVSPPRPDGESVYFRPGAASIDVCRFSELQLANNALVQGLIADDELRRLAESYLGCRPVLTNLAMWWSNTAQSDRAAREENAQMFHFDLDRVKWVKIFVYLTDVSQNTGPHVFVKGSHAAGSVPRRLLRGYCRYGDEEVESAFGADRIVEITGERGTVFVADTRGFHKGKEPVDDCRLLLQLEFAGSLIGAKYSRVGPVRLTDESLRAVSLAEPQLLQRWDTID